MTWENGVKRGWELIQQSPSLYMKGFESGMDACKVISHRFKSIAFLGVGGSGIVGDIVTDIISPTARHQLHTIKDYRVPIPLGMESLVIALSYSGNTAETISAAAEAYASDAFLVVVTSGGHLGNVAGRKGIPIIHVTGGLEPRYAVPEMVGAVLGLLSGLDVYRETGDLFKNSVAGLSGFLTKYSGVDGLQGFSEVMMGRVAAVIGHTHLRSTAYRLKAQLNENAKHPAYVAQLPEACHNEVEGWLPEHPLAYIIMRSRYEPPAISSALNLIIDHLERGGYPHRVLKVESSTYVDEIVKLIALSDLISVSLAAVKRVDPFQLQFIPQFRRILSLDGRLVETALRRFGADR
jgi:glucose/mannose-6-phosphate isomerase